MAQNLSHSPADVIRRLLIAKGEGTDPVDSGSWPVYATSRVNLPDNAIHVTDTTGRSEGRSMIDGELFRKSGFQVEVRAKDHATGWAKADSIQTTLAKSVRNEVIVWSSSAYRIQCCSGIGDVLPLGDDSPTTRRSLFTLNALAPVREVTLLNWDQFTGTEALDLGSHTPDYGGNWSVSAAGYKLYSNKTGTNVTTAGDRIAYVSSGQYDVLIQVDLVLGGQQTGVIFRLVDSANYVKVVLDASLDEVQLWTCIGSTLAQLASATFSCTAGDSKRMQVSVKGDSVGVFIDRVPVLQVLGVTAHGTATKTGIICREGTDVSGARWNDFIVTTV